MFDAYNIRKIAPRMLLAVIGVNISIYLCVAAVDITNVIGGGLGALIRGPFEATGSFGEQSISFGNTSNLGGGIVGAVGLGLLVKFHAALLGVAGGAFGLVLLVLLLLMVAAALIALAIMATVVIRFGAIILLTLVSPVAIALLVLPGTEKYFRRWWEYFIKTLAVYPIIAAIFAISDVMGAIFLKVQNDTNALNEAVIVIVLIVVVYAPLFMIPFSFKLAGGFLGSIYDLANKNMYGRAKPHMDKWKEKEDSLYGRAKDKAARAREKRGLTGRQIGSGLREGIKGAKHNEEDGLTRRQRIKERYKAASLSEKTQMAKEREAKAAESTLGKLLDGNDDVNWAALEKTDADKVKKLVERDGTTYNPNSVQGRRNIQQALAQISTMQSHYGDAAMKKVAAKNIVSAPTFTGEGLEAAAGIKLADLATKAAGGDSTAEKRILADLRQAAEHRADASKASYTDHAILQMERKEGARFARKDGKLIDADGNFVADSGKAAVFDESSRINLNDEAQVKQFETELQKSFMKSMHAKTSAGQRAGSHDRSVKTDVEYSQSVIDDMTAALPKGPNGEIDWKGDAAKKMLDDQDFQTAIADLQNTHEALQYSPQKSGTLSLELMKQYKGAMDAMQNGVPEYETREVEKEVIENGQKVVKKVEERVQTGLKTYDAYDALRRSWRSSQEFGDIASGGGDPSRRGQGPAG